MDRSPRQRATASTFQAVARFTGSGRFLSPDPGACAPGFTLSPAVAGFAYACFAGSSKRNADAELYFTARGGGFGDRVELGCVHAHDCGCSHHGHTATHHS